MTMCLISGCGQKGALYLPEDDRLPDKAMPQQEPIPETEALDGKAAKTPDQVPDNTMY